MPPSPTRLRSPYGSDRLVRLAARLRPALCDTLITVGSQEFPAHSLVLAGVSQQLGRRGHWALVKGISPSTFAQLLFFVYGESVELQPGELGPLEEAARTLGVQSLEEACKRARRDRARQELDVGLKDHQESETLPGDSETGLGGHGEKPRPETFVGAGGREQEAFCERRLPRESPEMAEAEQECQGEQSSKEKKLNQPSAGHSGVGGKQEVTMCMRESPAGPEGSREVLGSLSPPGPLQSSGIPRPWWAEAAWSGVGQPALWSILLLPPRYGTPFSHSTPIPAAWQEVWPWDQRIPPPLNPHKGLWSQNQLAFSNPVPGKPLTALCEPYTIASAGAGAPGPQTEQGPYFILLPPGSFPQSLAQLSPGEMEECNQRHTGEQGSALSPQSRCRGPDVLPGVLLLALSAFAFFIPTDTLATCVGHVGTAGDPSRQHPPQPPPARSRPYSCSVCGKRFSLKHQMETHYRVHTGEKPFSCGLCPQRSRDFSAMTKHLRTHGAAPYRCPLCQAGCPSLASMQAHMRGHSPSQLPPGWTIRSTFLYSSSPSSRPARASTSPCSSPSTTT
ncbi:Zinc finger and BTB domain-containing protein 32 [Galemys pyrenaicus]|uniref:Zinc finger and BTB domain-containing protein 32 n=1 Tax=Galemys pyrenaicus TaxID=202257 RepID=A0A8J6ANH4_GALPY|nr:Zinc finger and BTB domain-containing protein 32 [Galemys pyrenaicus]